MTRRLVALAVVASTIAATPLAAVATVHRAQRRAAVIAFVGESGINVLHHDFATVDGDDPVYPAGLPAVVGVSLPRTGSFDARRAQVRAGTLGHLEPGVLYALRGTRLMVVSAPGASPQTDVTGSGEQSIGTGASDPTMHGTGVVDAAIGRKFGTAPNALAVLVLGSAADAWAWVARQSWIDLASTSAYEPGIPCQAATAVRDFTRSGRLVFSSSGNTTDELEPLTSPNGLPDVYEVGGVDADGKPYLPPHNDSNPWFAVGTAVRPYETGELFSFTTAGYDGFGTTMRFGGTSGATPRTAGWAADLLMLAWRQHRASRGPLTDGRLTGPELRRLLHHVARPSQADGPAEFVTEGFGSLSRARVDLAAAVLAGRVAEPQRAEDDASDAAVEAARAAAFAAC